MDRNEKPTRDHSVCRIVVRLFIVLSLWHGPVPWLHCHESELLESASPASHLELRHHLATFHAGAELDQAHEFGWHFHWILPVWSRAFREPSNELPQPENVCANLDAIVASSTIPASIDRLFDGNSFQYSSMRNFTEAGPTLWRNAWCRRSQSRGEMPFVLRC